ncbi:MAG: GGDEF domain-containing protein [Pseudomonadota bacterium]|nr:GGDEF domain-containing protein [Pseudomonadota bacterium]
MAASQKQRRRGSASATPAQLKGAEGSERAKRRARRASGLAVADMPTEVRSEVMRLMDELDSLKAELDQARQRVNQLETMADEDPLLPVLNRRGFERELARAIAYMKRHNTTDSLVYCDLDGFKAINDTLGHAAGDAALKRVADVLIGQLRSSDIIGRLGGDEFAMVLHHADADAAERKAAQLCAALAADRFSHEGKPVALGMTTGTTQLLESDSVQSALSRADRLMYSRKRSHRAG